MTSEIKKTKLSSMLEPQGQAKSHKPMNLRATQSASFNLQNQEDDAHARSPNCHKLTNKKRKNYSQQR